MKPGEVHLWYLEPAVLATGRVRAVAESMLTDTEVSQHNAFQFNRDRDLFLATRLLARMALSSYVDLPPRALRFTRPPSGKPELMLARPSPALRFNLSNTQGLVACAVTLGRDIGVDVERVGETFPDVADTVFTPAERRILDEAPGADRARMFFTLWTLKEAFIKSTGDGLSTPLLEFAVALAPPRLVYHGGGIADSARWCFACHAPTAMHTLALCVADPDGEGIEVSHRWLAGESIDVA